METMNNKSFKSATRNTFVKNHPYHGTAGAISITGTIYIEYWCELEFKKGPANFWPYFNRGSIIAKSAWDISQPPLFNIIRNSDVCHWQTRFINGSWFKANDVTIPAETGQKYRRGETDDIDAVVEGTPHKLPPLPPTPKKSSRSQDSTDSRTLRSQQVPDRSSRTLQGASLPQRGTKRRLTFPGQSAQQPSSSKTHSVPLAQAQAQLEQPTQRLTASTTTITQETGQKYRRGETDDIDAVVEGTPHKLPPLPPTPKTGKQASL